MTHRLFTASAIAATLALGACASQPTTNAAVEAQRTRLTQLQGDPNVSQQAQAALTQAAQSLAAADHAARQGDAAQLNHEIFMTDREMSTAEAEAGAKTARARLAQGLQQAQRELQAYKTRETKQGTVVTLYDLPFSTGQATLSPGAAERLEPLVTYLKANPDRQIIVEGHTDSTGSRQVNQSLAQERAMAVAAFLETRGIPADRIVARGMGQDFPIASNATPSGRQENRRVDVVIASPPSTASLPSERRPIGGLQPDGR